MKQKLLTAYVFHQDTRRAPLTCISTDNFPVMVTNLEDAVTEKKKSFPDVLTGESTLHTRLHEVESCIAL